MTSIKDGPERVFSTLPRAVQTSARQRDLEPLDIVVLMTDGLVEALDRSGNHLGADLFSDIVRSAPHHPETINARIIEAVNETNGRRPLDDLTLVALQLGPGHPVR